MNQPNPNYPANTNPIPPTTQPNKPNPAPTTPPTPNLAPGQGNPTNQPRANYPNNTPDKATQ